MRKKMGVGTIYLMLAQAMTIICGYVIHVGLGRILGPEQYGIFGVLMSLYLMNRAFLNTGVPTTISKFIAESEEDVKKIVKISFKLQLIVSTIFCFTYVIFSKQIAGFLKDSTLTNHIIFLGIMVIPLSIVPLYNGFLQGLRKFKQQAFLRSSYPILRLIFTFFFVFLGFGILGALLGYFFSAIFVSLIGWFLLKKYKKIDAENKQEKINKKGFTKKIIKFALPLTISALAISQVRNINILFLKNFLIDNSIIGFYTAALTLSNSTYIIFAALSQTLLPAISKATSENNLDLVKKYIAESLKYLLMLLIPITGMIFITSNKVVTLLYSNVYSAAAPILNILIISSAFLTIFAVLLTIITGSGRPYLIMVINIIFVIFISILNYLLIPIHGVIGAAFASLIASGTATVFLGVYILTKYKVKIPLLSLIRILICSGVVIYFAKSWALSGIYLVLSYIVYGIIYLLLLYLFGEIKEEMFWYFRSFITLKKIE
jgi:stage V sporulation protein B